MRLIWTFVLIAATLLGFFDSILEGLLGCLFGYICSIFASFRIRELNSKICSYSGDDEDDIDRFCSFMTKATCFIGFINPALPIITIIVGIICGYRTSKITQAELGLNKSNPTNLTPDRSQPATYEYSVHGTRILYKSARL
jgi:uncharacterized membrane protein YeaQ/YmgE (transglycosylase-associated protein family)